jgi:hypothetical protein
MNGGTTQDVVDQLSSLSVYVGSQDDDQEFVQAGNSYSHPLFENFVFRFGGLNPNAAESDNAGQIDVSTSGEDTAAVSFTSDGDEAALEYGYIDGENQNILFEDSDDGAYVMEEGADITEDDYFTADAGDFAHLWRVTNMDTGNDKATVELQDQVTGQTVEADLDLDDTETNDPYEGTEIIDGQTYNFELNNAGDNLSVYWGDGASFDQADGANGVGTEGGVTSVYTAVDTESRAALTLADENGVTLTSDGTELQVELPSTESTDAATFNVTATSGSIDSLESTSSGTSVDTSANTVTVNNGQTYGLTASAGDITITPQAGGSDISDNSVLIIEPEDHSDTEAAYIVTTTSNTDGELDINSADYSGSAISSYATMEDNDDVSAAYDKYGAYSEYDSSDQGDFMLNLPFGQAAVGAAFTGEDGSLSSSATGGQSFTSMQPTGWPDVGALDSDDNIPQLKQDTNLILVGGPAVNDLTQELAQANKTMSREDYQQDGATVQLVRGAFTQGQNALIVAGFAGEDTREASSFIANYQENSEELAGQTQITLDTGTGAQAEEETPVNETGENDTLLDETDNQSDNDTDDTSGGLLDLF